ncbi:type I secretion system permease/ATPase [Litoribacillus peritrichatus]|uniref:Type I secretion system permease/ATPase n=1 Tax=Litoribacillus peritrichatus TaxID=718191 RepID=A0ABP7MHK6_9GAMM
MQHNFNTKDMLLGCLSVVCDILHRPHSPNALTAGLPLVDNQLTPSLFIRACERIGFNASLVERSLTEIPRDVLPCVLLLDDHKALVLTGVEDDPDTFMVIDPSEEDHQNHKAIPLQELEAQYTGQCLYLRNQFSISDSTDTLGTQDKQKEPAKNWILKTLKYSRSIYRDVILASIMINLFILANPLFVMNVYDRVVPNNAVETLWVLAIGVSIVFFFDFLIKVLRSHFIEVAGKKLDIILSAKLFQKALGVHFQYVPKSVGGYAQNIREFDHVRSFFSSVTITTLVDFPFAILFLIVIFSLGGPIVIAPITAALLILAYGYFAQWPLRKAIERSQVAYVQKNANLIESIQSLETIRAFNAEGQRQSQWEESVAFLSRNQVEIRRISNSVSQVSGFLTQLVSVSIIIIGVYLITEHEMSMGALIACVMLGSRAVSPMAQAANLIAQFEQTKQAVDTLNQLLSLPDDQLPDSRYIYRPALNGDIELKNVSFNYPEQNQTTLSNLNIHIKAGERVALIGRVGSGKSTLGKLLMGLFTPTQGQILFDGLDQKQINPADCRNNIGYIPQDIQVFNGTLRENIALKAPYIPDQEVLRVSDISLLSDFANHHSEGYSMKVGERGEGLSGGQRQQLSIARALVNDPPIIFMDECTSAMDNQSEQAIVQQFDKHLSGKTLLVSTHRASLLNLVNRIIVLEKGRIIADGPKDQVMDALKRGLLHTHPSKAKQEANS